MNWDKCLDVRHRLSSRIKNERNQSPTIPSCVEKTFYQWKNHTGQDCCVEVCANPMKISDNCVKTNNTWNQFICHAKMNQQFRKSCELKRDQFNLSEMFDNKREYIDYVVTNVLQQVVNHISLESLCQLSCYLPHHIADILRDTADIDSDWLVRILVTEILQCYGALAGQVTDWYAFATSIKSVFLPVKMKNNNKSEEKKSSNRTSSNHPKTTAVITPVSPVPDRNRSSENISPSASVTPQIMSTKSNVSPISMHSKETYTPIGAKYQPKARTDHIAGIENPESQPAEDGSKTQASPNHPEIQHQMSTDDHHDEQKSSKINQESSSSDYIFTIHHKYKHKQDTHHQHQKYERTFIVESSPIGTHLPVTRNKSQQNINLNSNNTEEIKSTDLSIDEQTFHFNLPISTNTDLEDLHSFQVSLHNAETSSADDTHLILTSRQSSSSNDPDKLHLSSSENHLQSNRNSIRSEKKALRLNHYQNMLADFD